MRTSRFLVSATLVLGLVACGGDDSDDSDSGDDAPTVEATDAGTADTSAPTAGSEATDAPAATDAETTGTEESAADDLPDIDACTLVTADDIASVVGVTPGDGTPNTTPPIFSCAYDFDSGYVVAGVLVWATPDEASESIAMTIDMNGYPAVEGVGDAAYDAAPAFGLTASSGRYEVDVNVSGPGDDPAAELEQEKQLLQLMIDRLP